MSLMTTLTDPPKASFRLSMLLYDTRYRSTTIQVVALLGFMLGAAWLINNVIVNLAVAGKTFDYGFLGEASGYDINQRLIEYNSQSTHLRAAFVGLLNTLLVAVMGCLAATILGVIIGVLRLSKNWVISRLAAVYVETLRNVPVLLWILLIMAATSETLPKPSQFRGDNATASMSVFDTVAVTNRGVYLPEPLFSNGLGDVSVFNPLVWPNSYSVDILGLFSINVTFALFVVALLSGWLFRRMAKARVDAAPNPALMKLGSTVIFFVPLVLWYFIMKILAGASERTDVQFNISLELVTILAVLFAGLMTSKLIKTRANQIQKDTGVRPVTWYWRLGVVVLPTLAVLYILGFYLGYPELKGFNFRGGIHMRSSLLALWVALSLYTAAFIAEIVRAGIMAISKGQAEAAAALGLRQNRIMSLVVLPQALRVIVPPLISQYLNLTKNSSLAIAVGYMDITGTLGGITLNQTGRELETVLLLMLIYLIISLTVSSVMNAYNERTKLKGR